MRWVVVAAMMAMTGSAQAEQPPICLGQNIAISTALLKEAGFRWGGSRELRCGGGTNEYGARIEKWPCLEQRWLAPDGSRLMLIYQRPQGYTPSKKNKEFVPGWIMAGAVDSRGKVNLLLCEE